MPILQASRNQEGGSWIIWNGVYNKGSKSVESYTDWKLPSRRDKIPMEWPESHWKNVNEEKDAKSLLLNAEANGENAGMNRAASMSLALCIPIWQFQWKNRCKKKGSFGGSNVGLLLPHPHLEFWTHSIDTFQFSMGYRAIGAWANTRITGLIADVIIVICDGNVWNSYPPYSHCTLRIGSVFLLEPQQRSPISRVYNIIE